VHTQAGTGEMVMNATGYVTEGPR